MVPDRHVDKAAIIEEYVVTTGKTVRPGVAVKLSSSLTNPNIREIEEAALLTDIVIGIAGGALGNDAIPDAYGRAVAGKTAYVAGDIVRVTHCWTVVEHAIAGAAGVTAGSRVAVDVATGSSGQLVNAPAMNPSGATATNSPGVALDTAATGEAFALAIMPAFYTST